MVKWKKTVRVAMKIFIGMISLGVLLTSAIGISSIFDIASSSEQNIQTDPESSELSIGAAGNYFHTEMNFNNTGHFDFENFQVDVEITLQNKTSSLNLTVLNNTLYGPATLEKMSPHFINMTATNETFDVARLYEDMGSSWYDPYLLEYMDANPSIDWESKPIEETSLPYILHRYDIRITLTIASKYNLNLVDFDLAYIEQKTFEDFYPSTTYEQLREDLILEYAT